jgi:hypothetical protein
MGKEQLLGSAQSKHTKAVPAFRASKASFPLSAFPGVTTATSLFSTNKQSREKGSALIHSPRARAPQGVYAGLCSEEYVCARGTVNVGTSVERFKRAGRIV